MTGTDQRIVHDPDGLNTGTLARVSPANLVTPTSRFFTRSHASIPRVDPGEWRLAVGGLVERPRQFSLDDLRALPRRQLTATLICAGLRRSELLSVAPMPGELPWGAEPVSTGHWSGVALGKVLELVGIQPTARHVEFVGLDDVERHGHRFGFGGSIDLEKALLGDVLLAMELDGAPLPPAHGFPVRVVVPGWVGARSVKWLGRIELLEQPSENYFQTKAYRVQRESHPDDPRDVSAGEALSRLALNAVIIEPAEHQPVAGPAVRIRGWAIGSEGQQVTAVEVSADDGHTWIEATQLTSPISWTWSFWEAALNLDPGPHTLVVRAFDKSGQAQPESLRDVWNVKGYANNAWHRVRIQVD